MNSYSKKQFSYLIVTIAYWTFMLSDGTLRMLVLLHFHQNGFSPLQLAYLFLFYVMFNSKLIPLFKLFIQFV